MVPDDSKDYLELSRRQVVGLCSGSLVTGALAGSIVSESLPLSSILDRECSSSPLVYDVSGWPTPHYDLSHSRCPPTSSCPVSPRDLTHSWSENSANEDPIPVVANGIVYLTVDRIDTQLVALDLPDGDELWSTKTTTPTDSPVAGGNVVIIPAERESGEDVTHALTAVDGTVERSLPFTNQPFVADGRLHVLQSGRSNSGESIERLQAYSINTGNRCWTQKIQGRVADRPAYDGQTVYYPVVDFGVVGIDSQTGAKIWREEVQNTHPDKISGTIRGHPIVSSGRVFISTYDGRLIALDRRDGTRLWTRAIRPVIVNNAARWYDLGAVSEGILVVRQRRHDDSADRLEAIDTKSGNQQWVIEPPGNGRFSLPTIGNNVVYAGVSGTSSESSEVSKGLGVFDLEAGLQQAFYPGPSGVSNGPVIADGRVVVPHFNGVRVLE
ncbi:PQQ-like beta-propeller repeat protein [Haloferax volcanii]|uniref:PQQ-like beta-propeller repeat protein n=1 Tax=Haloferax volcanii TaxID=2246 RepID=UPI00349FD0CC